MLYMSINLNRVLLHSDDVLMSQMYITWDSNIPYVPPRHLYMCEQSALSPAPSLVQNITIISYFIDHAEVTMYLEWSPPLTLNGELRSYEVCIGNEKLKPTDIVNSKSLTQCESEIVC